MEDVPIGKSTGLSWPLVAVEGNEVANEVGFLFVCGWFFGGAILGSVFKKHSKHKKGYKRRTYLLVDISLVG